MTYGIEGVMFLEALFKKSRLVFGESKFLPSQQSIHIFLITIYSSGRSSLDCINFLMTSSIYSCFKISLISSSISIHAKVHLK